MFFLQMWLKVNIREVFLYIIKIPNNKFFKWLLISATKINDKEIKKQKRAQVVIFVFIAKIRKNLAILQFTCY